MRTLVINLLLIVSSYMSFAKGDFSMSRVAIDVESLLAFKSSIKHDPSHVLGHWNVLSHNNSHCNWTGVVCSSRHPGRVVSLSLTEASLQGTISPHIGNLSFLLYLNISSNSLTGAIPPTIGELPKLQVLDLSYNSLGGVLPPLGRLKNLEILYAYYNHLTGYIPSSLLTCSKLKLIGLDSNNLSGHIPKDIGRLSQLLFLNLGNNSLTGSIPESIQNLTSLQVLELYDTNLGGIVPAWIGKLSKLQLLDLSNMSLSGKIPGSLTNCTSLQTLSLAFNSLHGTIPLHLGMLQNIEGLYLNNNRLNGYIPQSLSNATTLRVIELSQNSFQGSIPLSFARLAALEYFLAAENYIESGIADSSRPIPILQALSNCSKLYSLGLSTNKLEGTLPSVLPKNLEKLFLYENQISGNIPPSIGNASKLILLHVFSNNLKGFIPPTIAYFQSLQVLQLGDNLLEGSIPEEISYLNKTLYDVDLSNNHLTGSIPKSIGQLSSLGSLDLSNNLFSGRIPKEVGNCVSLEDLNLSFNNFSGEIPREIVNLKSIQTNFNLSNNRLSGTIPPEIRGLQMTLYIDLSNNSLSGPIGLYMAGWMNAEYINISFNNFSSNISKSFGTQQPGLKTFDISYNNFSGRVPPFLYNLSTLEFSNFSYNNFEGRVSCSGAFKKLNRSSFLDNHKLCGRCMGLPDCEDNSANHSHSHFYKTKWFITVVVFIVLACLMPLCYGLFFQKKKQGRPNMGVALDNQFKALSKEKLLRATNNLSEANIIGTGSYGTVYSGLLHSEEMVAVKVFNSVNQQRSNVSFIKECQTLGKVRHRNLTRIITVCCEDDFRAIVLPLMAKGNLHDLLHERDVEGLLTLITLEMKINIISELASALSYLHHDCTPTIIHCDVKPENILLDSDMTVKLSDFGIAKIMEGISLESATLSLRGSVGYIAPEYGMGGNVCSKGDVYSFGIVVLEMMTRKKPTDDMFSGSMSMLEWVSMSLAEPTLVRIVVEIANPREEDMKRIQGLMKLGLVCCNEEPHKRPTMREVENVLSRFVIGSDERRVMPNLDDILNSLHTSQAQPAQEHSVSSTF